MLQNTSAIDSLALRTPDNSTTTGGATQLITSTPFQSSGSTAYSSKKSASNVRRRIVSTPAPSAAVSSDGDNEIDISEMTSKMPEIGAMISKLQGISEFTSKAPVPGSGGGCVGGGGVNGSSGNTPGKLNFFSKINTNRSTTHCSKRASKICSVPQFTTTKYAAKSGTEQKTPFKTATPATTFHSSTTSFANASNCLSNPCGDGYTTATTITAAATAPVMPPQHLGKSDRMSKEKQKFFRHSAFNSDRIAKTSPPQASPSKSTARSNSNRTKASSNNDGDAFRSCSVAGNRLSSSSSDSSSSDEGSDDDSDDSDDDSTTSSSSSDEDSDESTHLGESNAKSTAQPQLRGYNLSSHASDDDSDEYSTTSSNSTSSDDDDDDDEIQLPSNKKLTKKQFHSVAKSSGNDSSSGSSLHKRHAGPKESSATWGFAAEAKKNFDIFQRASSCALSERVFGNFDGVDKESLVKVSNSSYGGQKSSTSNRASGHTRGLFDNSDAYTTNNCSRSKHQNNEADHKVIGRRKSNKTPKGDAAAVTGTKAASTKDVFKETRSTYKDYNKGFRCDDATTPNNTAHPKKTDFTKFLNAKNSSNGSGGSTSSSMNEDAKEYLKKVFAHNPESASTSRGAAAFVAANSQQHHNNNNINNKNKNNNHHSNNNTTNNNHNDNNNVSKNNSQKSKTPRRIALMSLPLDPKNIRYNSSSDDEIPYLTTPRNSNHIKSLNSNAVQNARCKQLNSNTTTSSNANSNSADSQLLFGFTNSNSQSLDFASLRETSGCLNSIAMSSNYPMLSSLSPHTPPYTKNQSMGKDQNQTNQKKKKTRTKKNSSTTLYIKTKIHQKIFLFETKKKCRKVRRHLICLFLF